MQEMSEGKAVQVCWSCRPWMERECYPEYGGAIEGWRVMAGEAGRPEKSPLIGPGGRGWWLVVTVEVKALDGFRGCVGERDSGGQVGRLEREGLWDFPHF